MKYNFFYYLKSKMPKCMYPFYIAYKYRKVTGKYCNLITPKTYTEKIQWCKLHRDNEKLANYADKIAVRKYVSEKIGEQFLVPVIGMGYTSSSEIIFDELPRSFVIKANHGCGYNLVVDDKEKIDIDLAKRKIDGWLKDNLAYHSYELQYKNICPRILIERNLHEKGIGDLPDYKFFCFNGKVFCLYLMVNTYPDHSKANLGIFDREFNLLPFYRADFRPIDFQVDKPPRFDEMITIAEKLAQGFSHVRIDLYNVEGKIYFGEMTFSTGSGLFKHVPDEFDLILGNQWNIYEGI